MEERKMSASAFPRLEEFATEHEIVGTALGYASELHEDHKRKSGGPYIVHPKRVAENLLRHGHKDDMTICQALLHDVKEMSDARIAEMAKIFGHEIAHNVHVLSRNSVSEQAITYHIMQNSAHTRKQARRIISNERILCGSKSVRRVKLADTIDNTADLETLSEAGIWTKLKESRDIFIPMGLYMKDFGMVEELRTNIKNFFGRFPEFKETFDSESLESQV